MGKEKRHHPSNYSLLMTQMVHVLPVSPSRKRTRGFAAVYKINWGRLEKLEITARETLNAFDLLTLLALTKAALESPLEDGGCYKGPDGKEEKRMYVLQIGVRQFVEGYRELKWGSRTREAVRQSLERLADCTWTYFYKGSEFSRVKILLDFKEEKQKKWLLWINKNFIDAAKKYKENLLFLKLNISYIQQCRTDIGKLLMVWLQGQRNTVCKEDLIFQALHLHYTEKKKSRYELKKAFDDVVAAGYLQSYKVEKKNSYYQFCWAYSTPCSKKQALKHGA